MNEPNKPRMMKLKILLILIILFGAVTFPAHAQSITLRLPDTTVVAGDLLDLPVYADQDLSGHSVLSYQIEIGFSLPGAARNNKGWHAKFLMEFRGV